MTTPPQQPYDNRSEEPDVADVVAWRRDSVAVDHAPVGIAHVAPDGSWLRVNDRLCEILGYTRDELLALSFQDITHPDDLEADLAEVRRMLAGKIDRYQMEKRYIRKGGSRVWVRLTVSLVRDAATGAPDYFVSVIEDIDAQKRAEAALGDSERRFRALVEGVKEYALFMTDTEGIILSWNPGVKRVLNWGEEIVGHHLRVIFTLEDQRAGVPEQEMATALQEGRASDERWHMRKDGSRFFAMGVVQPVRDEATGALLGFSKVMTDASTRHDYERRLAQKAALIDLAPDAIFVQEPTTNRITFWSRGAEVLYGWSRAEALGRVAYDLLQTEFPAGEGARTPIAILLRDGHWEGDLYHTTKDGRRLVVSSRWSLQRDAQDDGAPLAVLEVNRDVTTEREREAAQRRIAETVQRSLLMVPPPDAFPGLTLKPLYESASDDALIGGDFYDVFAVDQDTIALVVGDATGHGIEAATYTAEIKFALRAFLREYPHPAMALGRLNDFIADKEQLDPLHLGGSYVALSLCVVNTRTGQFACAWAGIEPPFVVRSQTGEAVELLECGGPLLGVVTSSEYSEQRATLNRGDVLAMSTDGLTEARRGRGRQREFFGYDGLVRAVREETQGIASLGDAAAAVARRARDFAGGVINDDLCLLLARRI